MSNKKGSDVKLIRAAADLAMRANGQNVYGIRFGSDIADGWACAWALGKRKIYPIESDDSTANESHVVIYTHDIDGYRIVVAAHDDRDAAEIENRLRNVIRKVAKDE